MAVGKPALPHSRKQILDKLREGDAGVVYVAEDTQLRRRVALKMLPAEKAATGERLERFKREAPRSPRSTTPTRGCAFTPLLEILKQRAGL